MAVPQTWRFYWTWLRYPWRMRRWFVGRMARAIRRPPVGWLEAAALDRAPRIVTVPWALIRLPFYLRARRSPPALGGSTLDWLVRWRFVVLGWADRVPRPPHRTPTSGTATT